MTQFGQRALPAILADDFRLLLEARGRVLVDLVVSDGQVVPVVRYAAEGAALSLMGVIVVDGEIVRGDDTAIALARLQLLTGRFDAVSLVGAGAETLGVRH